MTASDLPAYATGYDFADIKREDGILEVRFHTDGEEWQWTPRVHRQLPRLFREIADDHENRVVVLSGTGREWCGPVATGGPPSGVPARAWDRVFQEGRALLGNLLDIPVPIIAAVNGPAVRHAEIPLLSDVVLAAPTATFQDSAHFPNGLVPGDGMHVVMPLLLGLNRARYFLLTGQEIDAHRALELGLVAEVVAESDLLPRARDLARTILDQPPMVARYTRLLFSDMIRERLHGMLGFGLALEGLAVIGVPEES